MDRGSWARSRLEKRLAGQFPFEKLLRREQMLLVGFIEKSNSFPVLSHKLGGFEERCTSQWKGILIRGEEKRSIKLPVVASPLNTPDWVADLLLAMNIGTYSRDPSSTILQNLEWIYELAVFDNTQDTTTRGEKQSVTALHWTASAKYDHPDSLVLLEAAIGNPIAILHVIVVRIHSRRQYRHALLTYKLKLAESLEPRNLLMLTPFIQAIVIWFSLAAVWESRALQDNEKNILRVLCRLIMSGLITFFEHTEIMGCGRIERFTRNIHGEATAGEIEKHLQGLRREVEELILSIKPELVSRHFSIIEPPQTS
jgi:hypothetical protein